MTTPAEPVFVDTNILVYASVASAPLHNVALSSIQAYEASSTPLWISRQVIREYLAVLTRPQAFVIPSPASVIADARHFEERFHVGEDGPRITRELLALMERITIQGRQVHDANIVATMLGYGIRRLLTANDADFTRYASAISVVPLRPVQ